MLYTTHAQHGYRLYRNSISVHFLPVALIRTKIITIFCFHGIVGCTLNKASGTRQSLFGELSDPPTLPFGTLVQPHSISISARVWIFPARSGTILIVWTGWDRQEATYIANLVCICVGPSRTVCGHGETRFPSVNKEKNGITLFLPSTITTSEKGNGNTDTG